MSILEDFFIILFYFFNPCLYFFWFFLCAGKHTIFGRIKSGMDVVRRMGNLQTDKLDRWVDFSHTQYFAPTAHFPHLTPPDHPTSPAHSLRIWCQLPLIFCLVREKNDLLIIRSDVSMLRNVLIYVCAHVYAHSFEMRDSQIDINTNSSIFLRIGSFNSTQNKLRVNEIVCVSWKVHEALLWVQKHIVKIRRKNKHFKKQICSSKNLPR